jgi:hypothetical protein
MGDSGAIHPVAPIWRGASVAGHRGAGASRRDDAGAGSASRRDGCTPPWPSLIQRLRESLLPTCLIMQVGFRWTLPVVAHGSALAAHSSALRKRLTDSDGVSPKFSATIFDPPSALRHCRRGKYTIRIRQFSGPSRTGTTAAEKIALRGCDASPRRYCKNGELRRRFLSALAIKIWAAGKATR